MARTDWDTDDQAFALYSLITGTALSLVGPDPGPGSVGDPLSVLGRAVAALLGPDLADEDQTRSAATAVIDFLKEGRATVLRLTS